MALDPTAILRLVVPQWQGRGNPVYLIGSRILDAIAPAATRPAETINAPLTSADDTSLQQGILWHEPLLAQLKAARAVIDKHQPEAIVTLGGDCLVDLVPIAYLHKRYPEDLAVLWIDAHPDIMAPAQFEHAHVLSILKGVGDAEFVSTVDQPLKSSQILYVGLTETTAFKTGFINQHGIKHLGPEALVDSFEPVLEWIRASGAKHIAVHFDLDVLAPRQYDFLYFRNPEAAPGAFDGIAQGRMRWEQISSLLQASRQEAEIVGLAITEYLPWSVAKLASGLADLPLLGKQ